MRDIRASSPRQRLASLLTLGAASELIYLLYLVRLFPLVAYFRTSTDLGGLTNHSVAGFATFIGWFSLLFVLVLAAASLARTVEHDAVPLVLGVGAVLAATLVFVYPITANDLYSYVESSWIMVFHHQNPVYVTPSSYPTDPASPLTGEWSTFGSPYGPIGMIVNALPVLLTGPHLLLNLLGEKVLYSLTLLADAYLVGRILQRLRPDFVVAGVVLVAWNPLLLFETAANGHNDVLMMFFALLGMLAVVDEQPVLGTVLLVASALVKYATLVLLPLVVLHVLVACPDRRARLRYLALSATGAAVVAFLAYHPFWSGWDTLDRSLLENQLHLDSFSSVLSTVVPSLFPLDRAVLLGRVLFALFYLYALLLTMRGRRDVLAGMFLAFFFVLALAVTDFKTWYAGWPLLLAAASGRWSLSLSALAFTWGATISAALYGYVWVWLGLGQLSSFVVANTLAYAVAFGPAALLLSLVLRGLRARGREGSAPSPLPSSPCPPIRRCRRR